MTSSTTIKFPGSTSKYGQGDTVAIDIHSRLSDCISCFWASNCEGFLHVARCLLEAEEWPSSLFDCASPHSSGFHMFAALDPIFEKILWKLMAHHDESFIDYHFFVPVVPGLSCVLQSEFN